MNENCSIFYEKSKSEHKKNYSELETPKKEVIIQ